jgi:hypothetical protein
MATLLATTRNGLVSALAAFKNDLNHQRQQPPSLKV